MINKKVIICTTIKNESKNLNNFFKKIDSLIYQFKDYHLIFVESNSTDNSLEKINNYLRNRKGNLIKKDFLKTYNRIHKLEICRNEYLDYIKNDARIKNYDYLIVMDADGVNNQININKILNSLKKENWNAIFANQNLFYYDVFALRIKDVITTNFISNIKEDIKNKKYKDIRENVFNNLTKFFYLNKLFNERYITVKSAFGGFGIYQLKIILEFKYHSENGQYCEHVGLNESIYNKYGGLFIDKNLTNSIGINKHTINGYLCSKSNFLAKRFISKFL